MMRDYSEQIQEFWPTIMQAWEAHADKRPVIECDVIGKKVRAYATLESWRVHERFLKEG